ncbi:MAG: histidinol-phosphatase HisJ family protein [Clostridia bacterium]|nr:histidinol-phosphatase HisJ family protein [Clostridia bacterium]
MNFDCKSLKTKKFVADMHTHTDSSPDCSCDIDDLCKAQINKGTSVFAITDHFNMDAKDSGEDIDAPIVSSFKKATEAAEKYKDKIEILRGIEVGEGIWYKDVAEKMIGRFDFDVVIGSVHTVITEEIKGPYSMFDFSTLSSEELERFVVKYFDDLLNTANQCDYDILAHLNCPERYVNGKYKIGYDFMKHEEIIREILKTVIRRDKALELNTSNNSFCKGFFMPDAKILSIYHDLGGSLLTIGSDAHFAENACIAFDQAEEILHSLGFSTLCCFRKRKAFLYNF